ncbi:MAG TPA: energy transducer TonB [Blastocatellia bacterium]|nr:energy transducer TonB [Blastocatellia bacterium]
MPDGLSIISCQTSTLFGNKETHMNTLRRSLVKTCAAIALFPFSRLMGKAQESQQQTSARTGRIDLTSFKAVISDEEAKELRKVLEQTIDIPIQVTASNGSPVTIVDAKIRGIKREPQTNAAGELTTPINDYAMKATINLYNNSEERISVVGLQLLNNQANHMFYIYPRTLALGGRKNQKVEIVLMTLSGDPAHLAVKVVGGQFENGKTWGEFPFPRPLKDSTPLPNNLQTDKQPRALIRGAPRYTEEARVHKVLGVVGLHIEVGVDGSVTDFRVTNALPDGLTEEAIKSMLSLKFLPAMKKGAPIACWIKTSVEFNLK